MGWSADVPNPAIPQWAQASCSVYALWPFANKCRAACPYCLVGYTKEAWARSWTDAEALAGWDHIASRHGPCYILCGGREPSEEIPLLAGVLQYHYGSIASNCMFDVTAFCDLIPPERCELHPSFHPHLWADLDEFLSKLAVLRGLGYRIPSVALVGWPDWLPYWDEWLPRLRQAGLMPNPAPARQTSYAGRALPAGYLPEELEVLRRHIWPAVLATTQPPSAEQQRGRICAAGHAAFAVMADGRVERCTQVGGAMGVQNLCAAEDLRLLDVPTYCGEAGCVCTNMWAFHL